MLLVPSLTLGGAEKITVELANLMAEHHRTMLVAAQDGPLHSEVSSRVDLRLLEVPRMRMAFPSLRRIVRMERPVAIISALGQANFMASWATLGLKHAPPLILAEHTDISSLERTEKWRAKAIVWSSYWRASRVVAVSEGGRVAIESNAPWLSGRMSVVPNPVISPRKLALVDERVTHPWFADDSRPLLMAVGRLNEAKDYPTLLRAVGELQSSVRPRLIVLGEGELRPELERRVAELGLSRAVDLLGTVDNPMAWLRNADAYVMSSRREGLPSALIEALAVGAKVVSTDCPSGPREILRGETYGWLAPVGDFRALARRIEVALTSPVPAGTLGRAMDFSSERSLAAYEALITP